MRLKCGLCQTIGVAKKTVVKNDVGETCEGWGERRQLVADVQPLTDNLSRQLWGEKAFDMRTLRTQEAIHKGEGVWLADDVSDTPPWRVKSLQRWPNVYVAEIERIDR